MKPFTVEMAGMLPTDGWAVLKGVLKQGCAEHATSAAKHEYVLDMDSLTEKRNRKTATQTACSGLLADLLRRKI